MRQLAFARDFPGPVCLGMSMLAAWGCVMWNGPPQADLVWAWVGCGMGLEGTPPHSRMWWIWAMAVSWMNRRAMRNEVYGHASVLLVISPPDA